jgi:hypothetical protein
MPSDPAAAVRSLRTCRDAMIRLSIEVKIGNLVYQRALVIIAAIDALAAELTGERDYFHALGAGATKEQLRAMEERAARERGEMPWKISGD